MDKFVSQGLYMVITLIIFVKGLTDVRFFAIINTGFVSIKIRRRYDEL